MIKKNADNFNCALVRLQQKNIMHYVIVKKISDLLRLVFFCYRLYPEGGAFLTQPVYIDQALY